MVGGASLSPPPEKKVEKKILKRSIVSGLTQHPAGRSLLSLARFWYTPEQKTLHESRKVFVEHDLQVARKQFQTQA